LTLNYAEIKNTLAFDIRNPTCSQINDRNITVPLHFCEVKNKYILFYLKFEIKTKNFVEQTYFTVRIKLKIKLGL
jgi:hypothetical protein